MSNKVVSEQPVCPWCGAIGISIGNMSIQIQADLRKPDGKEFIWSCDNCKEPFKIDYDLTFSTERI